MRLLVIVHRWLGTAFCLLFALWFVSGIVMMYARMPELAREERARRLSPLDLTRLRVAPSGAFAPLHLDDVERVRVGMLLGRPVYRGLAHGVWQTVFGDTGERLERLTGEQALDESRRFLPEHASTARVAALLTDPDQWTLQNRASLPLFRVAAGDPGRIDLYVAERTGEVAVKTTARERRLAYAGAVLHWLYFAPLRRHAAVWAQAVIWLALAGTIMCAAGVIWGMYVALTVRGAPYRGWMRWHHLAGLTFGATTLTWVFSGLLSMDPWGWHPETAATRAQRDAMSGGPLRLDLIAIDDLRARLASGSAPREAGAPREIEIVQFHGRPILLVDGQAPAAIDDDTLAAAARGAMNDAPIEDVTRIDAYDAYYYDRRRTLPLPVLRIRFADAPRTWLYVDPVQGRILRKEERLTRVNRWLYHGLHSLDLPVLYFRRPAWDLVVILLSLGGLGSAVTSVAPAWARLRRRERWYSYPILRRKP